MIGHPTQHTHTVYSRDFINNNDYICHCVHIELRVRVAASSAAFLASFLGELLAWRAWRAAARLIAALILLTLLNRLFRFTLTRFLSRVILVLSS